VSTTQDQFPRETAGWPAARAAEVARLADGERDRPAVTERRDVVVVGGGQAGLAIGYFLNQQNRDFTILEAAGTPAAAWRERWDSLRLFTPGRRNSLPGVPFPGDPDRYPPRDEVVAYLTDYARELDLPVELDSRVRAVRAAGDGYVVELDDRAIAAAQVVVATGPFQVPVVPPIAERLDPGVAQLHSTAYRNPAQIPDGPVLVVGGGNTGYQIAGELAHAHEVHLSVGARQTPLPQRILGRDLFSYLEALGLMRVAVTSRLGRRMQHRETLIGSSPRAARRRGIRLHGRTVDVSAREVRFADGSTVSPVAVVWATGFRLDHSLVDAPVFDGAGRPVHERGVTASEGLYFLGLPWQHTRGSALLGWVEDDAEFIARRIAEVAERRGAAAPGEQAVAR
jgi:putative flavoprotein involved in K+ transport